MSRKGDKCMFEHSSVGCGGVGSIPKTARVIYSRIDFSGVRVLVPGSDEFVEFTIGSPRSEMYSQKGDKIQFRYMVFDSPKFDKHLVTADFTRRVEFEAGSDKVWPWLVLATEEMSVGDERSVQVPVKVAAGTTKWLTEPEKSKMIYASIRLMSVERAKK